MKDKHRKILIIFFSAVFIFGFVLGSLIQKNDRVNKVISNFSLNLINIRTGGDALRIFLSSLLVNLAVLFLILAFNRSRICIVFNTFVLLINGIGKGAIVSNIVYMYGTYGLVVSTVILLPGMVTATCAAILLAAQSVGFGTSRTNQVCFKQRFYTLLIYIILIFFSAGLDVSFAKLYKALM